VHRYFSFVLLAFVGSRAASAPTLEVVGPRRAVPAAAVPGQPPPVTPIVVVPGLPFVDSATTCEFSDALRPPCADLSSAPEVVYAYTPATDQRVDFLVSGWDVFDAALFVMSSDSVVACNNDGWGRDPRLYRVPLRGGTTYFIVVDGSESSCGAFTLHVEETPPPCPLTCPPGSIPEGETVCHATYVDTYDCGCNQFPPAFRDLPCGDDGVTVCGTYGTYAYFSEEWRDTDWFRFVLPETALVSCRVSGQAETQLAVMRAVDGCDDRPLICDSAFAPPCDTVVCEQTLEAGLYYVFVAPRHFVGVECGAAYVLQLDGLRCPPVDTQSVSWSRVRAIYR
jgi:hypothetical protein